MAAHGALPGVGSVTPMDDDTVETEMKGEGSGNGVVRPDTARAAAGFTLIELIVTIAVLAILLAIAAPSLETMLNQNRLAAASDQVIATLQNARMEAVRQNRRVMICDSSDGSQCQCCQRKWNGLLLARPEGDNGGKSLAFTQLKSTVEFIPGNAFNSRYWEDRVAYRADGRPASGAWSLSRPLTLRVCIPTTRPANNIRDVLLHPSGRIEVTSASGSGKCPVPDTTPS